MISIPQCWSYSFWELDLCKFPNCICASDDLRAFVLDRSTIWNLLQFGCAGRLQQSLKMANKFAFNIRISMVSMILPTYRRKQLHSIQWHDSCATIQQHCQLHQHRGHNWSCQRASTKIVNASQIEIVIVNNNWIRFDIHTNRLFGGS